MFMPRQVQAEETQEIDVYEIVFGHIEDAYEWHITDIGDASIRIPLPVIVKSSSRLAYIFFCPSEKPGPIRRIIHRTGWRIQK